MRRFSGTPLDTNTFRSIRIKGLNQPKPTIKFQNPFDENPYRSGVSRKELCRFWALENQIRSEELDRFRKNNG